MPNWIQKRSGWGTTVPFGYIGGGSAQQGGPSPGGVGDGGMPFAVAPGYSPVNFGDGRNNAGELIDPASTGASWLSNNSRGLGLAGGASWPNVIKPNLKEFSIHILMDLRSFSGQASFFSIPYANGSWSVPFAALFFGSIGGSDRGKLVRATSAGSFETAESVSPYYDNFDSKPFPQIYTASCTGELVSYKKPDGNLTTPSYVHFFKNCEAYDTNVDWSSAGFTNSAERICIANQSNSSPGTAPVATINSVVFIERPMECMSALFAPWTSIYRRLYDAGVVTTAFLDFWPTLSRYKADWTRRRR